MNIDMYLCIDASYSQRRGIPESTVVTIRNYTELLTPLEKNYAELYGNDLRRAKDTTKSCCRNSSNEILLFVLEVNADLCIRLMTCAHLNFWPQAARACVQ